LTRAVTRAWLALWQLLRRCVGGIWPEQAVKPLPLVLLVAGIASLGAVAAGCQVSGASNASSERVQIVAEEMRFSPNRIDVRVGQVLEIDLINRGQQRHDLAFPSLEMPGLRGQETAVEPGGESTLRITFDRPGSYTFICTVPGHAASGMTGAVFVNP
jgi:plastocyanin